MRRKGRPKATLETVENNAKILTLFSLLVTFLAATQGHFQGLGEQSDRKRKDNPYLFFCILSMQVPQQLSLVELLMVKVKICRLRNKASFKYLLFTK